MTSKELLPKWEDMFAGIQDQVGIVESFPDAIHGKLADEWQLDRIPSRIYLVGCGDSFYAGLATQFAFESWTGIPTTAMEALTFSRYALETVPKDALVIALSISGRVSRTIEAVVKSLQQGIHTVVFTSDLDSLITRTGARILPIDYGERRFAPGTSSYMASLLSFFCAAIITGRKSSRLTETAAIEKIDEISNLAPGVQRTTDENYALIGEFVAQVSESAKYVYVGGGSNYGTAVFSRVKMIEAVGITCLAQELEEWAHVEYFIADSDTYTIFFLPPGASVDRGREQIWAANQRGSFTIAVCSPDDEGTQAISDLALPVYGTCAELLTPIGYCVPGSLIAYAIGSALGVTMFGFDDARKREINQQQIFESMIQR